MVISKSILLILSVIIGNLNGFDANSESIRNNTQQNASENRFENVHFENELKNKFHVQHKRSKREDDADKGNIDYD